MRPVRAGIVVLGSFFCLLLVSDFLIPAEAGTKRVAPACVDVDGDGWCEAEDCNDADPYVHPGQEEIPYDSIDQNCDGSDGPICYADVDNDGFGDPYNIIVSLDGDCTDPGETPTGSDCDDGDDTVYPGAPEIPDDGIDQDCDGSDMSSVPVELSTWSRIKALYGG